MLHRLAATALVAGLLLAPTPAKADTACQDLSFPVTVMGSAHTMAGTLCAPSGATTLQVLVPGGFYNRAYWDITLEPGVRSFRRAMNDAGHATLAVDRLGSGRSSVPFSATLTASAQMSAVHQVVTAMRPRYQRIILGGHSIGSAVAIMAAATYRDVDGVLVTGLAHRLNAVGVAGIAATFSPAILDPSLGGRLLDPGYLTTLAGARYAMHRPGPDIPAVIAFDETTKDVAVAGEFVDSILLTEVLPHTAAVDVPVLTVVGGRDPSFCAPLATACGSAAAYRASEAPFFGPGARLEGHVVPGYGHSLNFSANAPNYHAAVVDWANRMVRP